MKRILSLLFVAFMCVLSVKAEDTVKEFEGDGIAKKWELRLDAGIESSLGGGVALFDRDGGALFELGLGYNLSSNWYLGVVSGFFYKVGRSEDIDANNTIPVLANLTYRWNLGKKWSIFADGRAGYLFSVKGVENFSGGKSYDYPNVTFLNVMPGVIYRVKPNIDLKLSFGYGYFLTNDDEAEGDYMHSGNTLVAKVGMNFRKAPKPIVRVTPIEEPVVEEPVKEPEPEPVKVVETTTEVHRQLGERQVVIFYTKRMHNILPEKDLLLQEMAEFVKTHKTSKIVLKSYADKNTGNYEVNQTYSRERMEEVYKHLIEYYGIAPEQIEASYYGDTIQPFEVNDMNRCSIITVKEIE